MAWLGKHAPANVEEIATGLGFDVAVVESLLADLEALELVASRDVGGVC